MLSNLYDLTKIFQLNNKPQASTEQKEAWLKYAYELSLKRTSASDKHAYEKKRNQESFRTSDASIYQYQ